MPNLLNNLNERANEYKGKRLTRMLLIIFGIFLLLGLSFGIVYGKFTEKKLAENLQESPENPDENAYEGVITYIEPFLHPEDEISYVLVDGKGEDVILLKAKDQKLVVSEGHFATVYGQKRKTIQKEDYLLVDRIVIKNASN